jgi:hypothetical protein
MFPVLHTFSNGMPLEKPFITTKSFTLKSLYELAITHAILFLKLLKPSSLFFKSN